MSAFRAWYTVKVATAENCRETVGDSWCCQEVWKLKPASFRVDEVSLRCSQAVLNVDSIFSRHLKKIFPN